MRQSWQFRLLGLLMLPLYATGAWIAPTLQVCPMHGSPASAHASMQMPEAPNGHAEHLTAAGQGAEAQSPAAAQASSSESGSVAASNAPAQSHQHGCDCLGCCAGSNGPAVPVTQLALAQPAQPKYEPFELKNAEAAVTRLAYVLPFATAPPHPLV